MTSECNVHITSIEGRRYVTLAYVPTVPTPEVMVENVRSVGRKVGRAKNAEVYESPSGDRFELYLTPEGRLRFFVANLLLAGSDPGDAERPTSVGQNESKVGFYSYVPPVPYYLDLPSVLDREAVRIGSERCPEIGYPSAVMDVYEVGGSLSEIELRYKTPARGSYLDIRVFLRTGFIGDDGQSPS